MKTLNLHQKARLNTGVIGELKLGGLTLQTLEGTDCLEPGKYTVSFVGSTMVIDGDYKVCMDANGQYRSKGLCVGMVWDFRSFDLNRKGEALQALFTAVGNEAEIIVTRAGEDVKEKLTECLEDLNEARGALAEAQKTLEQVTADADAKVEAETRVLRAAIKHLMKDVKALSVKEFEALTQGEGDESDGDDSGA